MSLAKKLLIPLVVLSLTSCTISTYIVQSRREFKTILYDRVNEKTGLREIAYDGRIKNKIPEIIFYYERDFIRGFKLNRIEYDWDEDGITDMVSLESPLRKDHIYFIRINPLKKNNLNQLQ